MYILNKNNKHKGFSLIELIVVMGIMAIIVLIAVPKFIGYTKEARLSKIKTSAKEIESASDRYYLKNDDWPRATSEDDYYSKDELESYAKEIYDKTGTIIHLEETGHYYDIDYMALKNYVRVPDDSVKYIIQNPVGRVYYLDKLTPEGEQIFNKGKDDTQIVTPTPIPEPELEPSDEGWFIIDDNGAVSASDTLKALTGLIDIIIPQTIRGIESKSIKPMGFYSMQNIKNIVIPNTVITIGDSAFRKSSLETVKLPESLINIGTYAFNETKNIKTVEIPKNVTSIGNFAFYQWTNAQTITINERDNKDITITSDTWSGSAKVVFENIDDYYVVDNLGAIYANGALKNTSGPIDLNIPSEINEIIVKSIKSSGFKHLTNIENVAIPNTVITIEFGAFQNSNFKTIKLSNSLKSIGNSAFYSNETLKEVIIHEGVLNIGERAFHNCKILETVKLPDSLVDIGAYAFNETTNIKTIGIPKNVTSIGNFAFYKWTNAQTITINKRDNKDIAITSDTWSGSAKVVFENIDNYYVVDNLGAIYANGALKNTFGPIDLNIPSEINEIIVTSIKSSGFKNLTNIKNVTIPNTVIKIGLGAFQNSSSLEYVQIPNSVKVIEGSAFYNVGIKELIIPDSVIIVGESAFQSCSNLTSITLSNSMTKLSKYIFMSTANVKSIEIPSNIIEIENFAFENWTSNQSIIIKERNNKTLTLGNYWKSKAVIVTYEDVQ